MPDDRGRPARGQLAVGSGFPALPWDWVLIRPASGTQPNRRATSDRSRSSSPQAARSQASRAEGSISYAFKTSSSTLLLNRDSMRLHLITDRWPSPSDARCASGDRPRRVGPPEAEGRGPGGRALPCSVQPGFRTCPHAPPTRECPDSGGTGLPSRRTAAATSDARSGRTRMTRAYAADPLRRSDMPPGRAVRTPTSIDGPDFDTMSLGRGPAFRRKAAWNVHGQTGGIRDKMHSHGLHREVDNAPRGHPDLARRARGRPMPYTPSGESPWF